MLDAGDVEGAAVASGLHRATLYRAKAKRDAGHRGRRQPPDRRAKGTGALRTEIVEIAPTWSALRTTGDLRAGYSWTAMALIEGRIGAKEANALTVLLGGAARVVEPEPAQVDDIEVVRSAIAEVIAGMSDEEIDAMAAEHDDLERRARRGDELAADRQLVALVEPGACSPALPCRAMA